jgi:hypothetical protein
MPENCTAYWNHVLTVSRAVEAVGEADGLDGNTKVSPFVILHA